VHIANGDGRMTPEKRRFVTVATAHAQMNILVSRPGGPTSHPSDMIARALPILVWLSFASACIERISVPQCEPVAFTEASVSGDTITTTTGLRYIEGISSSSVAVEWCTNIAIHYDAFLLDGTRFDSSRESQPLVFAPGLGGLIDGIEQGVIGMRQGATRRLIIPPALAFGSEPRRHPNGDVVIPGNSTVVYDIEIVAVSP
jgi:hypothetical protein